MAQTQKGRGENSAGQSQWAEHSGCEGKAAEWADGWKKQSKHTWTHWQALCPNWSHLPPEEVISVGNEARARLEQEGRGSGAQGRALGAQWEPCRRSSAARAVPLARELLQPLLCCRSGAGQELWGQGGLCAAAHSAAEPAALLSPLVPSCSLPVLYRKSKMCPQQRSTCHPFAVPGRNLPSLQSFPSTSPALYEGLQTLPAMFLCLLCWNGCWSTKQM